MILFRNYENFIGYESVMLLDTMPDTSCYLSRGIAQSEDDSWQETPREICQGQICIISGSYDAYGTTDRPSKHNVSIWPLITRPVKFVARAARCHALFIPSRNHIIGIRC
jgi:hypothetical protein